MQTALRHRSTRADVSPLRGDAARQALVRLLTALLATAALLVVWRPAVVHAQPAAVVDTATAPQDTTRRTHVVKAGETLWSLAARYYGDGHQWQELARRNGISPTSRKPLLVGVRLQVPATPPRTVAGAARSARPGADVPAVATTPATPPAPPAAAGADRARTGQSLSAQTSGRGDAGRGDAARGATRAAPKTPTVVAGTPADSARDERMRATIKTETPIGRGPTRIGLVDPAAAVAARGREPSTIFLLRLPTADETDRMMQAAQPRYTPRPRVGEFNAAPFTLDQDALARGGTIVRRVGSTATGSLRDAQDRALVADEVEVTWIPGSPLAVGDELVAVSDAGPLRPGSPAVRVVVPSGVLRVIRVEAGKPVVAEVRSQTGVVSAGQRLIRAGLGPTAPVPTQPSATGDIAGTVLWVENGALLPTLQSFVILSAGTAEGVKPGDQFALVRPRGSVNTGEEERIAIVRVVRTGPGGSSAIVVKQERGEIATGVTVRRVARVP